MKPPVIDNAPGLKWRPRKNGLEARWYARTDCVTGGYMPKSVGLAIIEGEPTQRDIDWIQDRCNAMQRDMLLWKRGGIPENGKAFDGTLRGLVDCYQTDELSPYNHVRYVTRVNYDTMLRRLVAGNGATRIEDIKPRTILGWHLEWAKRGIPTARGLITMLRGVLSYGSNLLEDDACARVRGILAGMKFKTVGAREEVLTADQATAIRAKAHEEGMPALALAQAFQFECTLRQKDVIGEWLPLNEPGPLSDVIWEVHGLRWVRGLRWEEIDENLILRHVTSKKEKAIEVNLRFAPMVMEELAKLGERPTEGPIVINPDTEQPYRNFQFRRRWREIADLCGIPKAVKNMDSRAGAITEGTDVASIEDVRHAATHSNVSMTSRYSRTAAKKTARVMELRAASRNKTGTDKG